MTGLRDKKKQATHTAIAESAANIVLREGFDALTVAAVADAAGVSPPRTFHNYFSSLEEPPLVDFIAGTFAVIAEDIRALPPTGLDMLDVLERLLGDALSDDGVELYSLSTLLAIGQAMEMQHRGPSALGADEETARAAAAPIITAFQERFPSMDEFDILVALQAGAGGGIGHALHIYDELGPDRTPPEQGRALIARAVRVVRGIGKLRA